MRGVLAVIFLLGVGLFALAQDASLADTQAPEERSPGFVFYDERDDGALTWGDFQGSVPKKVEIPEEAEILWAISYPPWQTDAVRGGEGCELKVKRGTPKIREAMSLTESWVKPNSKTAALLAHEQGHFHLVHIYARKLQKLIDELLKEGKLSGKGRDRDVAWANLKEEIEKLVERYTGKCDEIQTLYDKETEHGTNARQQAAWDRKIKRWLGKPDDAPDP